MLLPFTYKAIQWVPIDLNLNHWIALYVNGNKRRASYDAISFDSFRSWTFKNS